MLYNVILQYSANRFLSITNKTKECHLLIFSLYGFVSLFMAFCVTLCYTSFPSLSSFSKTLRRKHVPFFPLIRAVQAGESASSSQSQSQTKSSTDASSSNAQSSAAPKIPKRPVYSSESIKQSLTFIWIWIWTC